MDFMEFAWLDEEFPEEPTSEELVSAWRVLWQQIVTRSKTAAYIEKNCVPNGWDPLNGLGLSGGITIQPREWEVRLTMVQGKVASQSKVSDKEMVSDVTYRSATLSHKAASACLLALNDDNRRVVLKNWFGDLMNLFEEKAAESEDWSIVADAKSCLPAIYQALMQGKVHTNFETPKSEKKLQHFPGLEERLRNLPPGNF